MALEFKYFVTNPGLTTPSNLAYSLTAQGVGITVLDGGARGILFNDPIVTTGLQNAYRTNLLVGNNTRINIDHVYHGTTFAVVNEDYTISTFTASSASNSRSIVPAGRDYSSPETRRLWNLNG